MTNKEILEKAFMIATHNGCQQRSEEPDVFQIPEAFIYRHDFAKALWGELPLVETTQELNRLNTHTELKHRYVFGTSTWEYHLQQMVIAPDPIAYLGEHI